MAARAGFEPATLRSKGIDSINAPPRLTTIRHRTGFMAMVSVQHSCLQVICLNEQTMKFATDASEREEQPCLMSYD